MKINLLKPSIAVKAKNPKMAIYARVIAFLSVALILISALFQLISFQLPSSFLSILIALFIFLIEENKIDLAFLRQPLQRGVVYIILAVVLTQANFFSIGGLLGLLLLSSGVLNLVYHFQ